MNQEPQQFKRLIKAYVCFSTVLQWRVALKGMAFFVLVWGGFHLDLINIIRSIKSHKEQTPQTFPCFMTPLQFTFIIFLLSMDQHQPQPNKNKQSNNGKNSKDYSKLTHEELIATIHNLQKENKRLKNRLADHEPFKQKVLRGSNEAKLAKLFEKYQLRKYALKVCYLGHNYDGMACQAESDNSIQEYIFKALNALSLVPKCFPADESFTRAGRTDKGVSAMGNVICLNLRTDIQKGSDSEGKESKMNYCSMMNSILPQDIRIIGCEEVVADFNARYWCTRRRYKYFFARNNLNIELMRQSIKDFEGTHNFINFCKINVTNTVNFERTIFSAEILKASPNEQLEEGDNRNQIYYFYYVGNSFLWHQIRFMSSVLFMIGLGQQPPHIIKDLLDVQKHPRKPNYPMAPDYPLILEDCEYPQLKFEKTDPNIIYGFYNTFNEMVMRKSIEKVMIVNCMILARRHLITHALTTEDSFKERVMEKGKVNAKGKSMQLHKSSARGLDEAISSLKGKKLQLYLKKAEKQAQYEQRVKNEANKEKEGGEQADQ